MKHRFLFIVVVLCALTTAAQIDTLQVLPEVILSDSKLKNHSVGIALEKISDSTIQRSRTALTEVLRANSTIYFRENGPGGVASASFRGTNAAQTAVVWNGININSQLTGQSDFNTLSSKNYDQLDVRVGGGSIIYGSGAVGGSVHLGNDIRFNKGLSTTVTAGYGSFDTQIATAKTQFSNTNFYIDAGLDYQRSENDFDYLDTDNQFNENGQYDNLNAIFNMGYLLKNKGDRTHLLKLHHNTYVGNRNFSGTLTAPSNDGYEDRNTRTLAIWENLGTRFNGKLRAAHIFEQFRYFANNQTDDNDLGKSIRYLANYEATYKLDRKKELTVIGEVNHISAAGASIVSTTRNQGSIVALWKQQLTNQFTYEIQARQELVEGFDSPFLLGAGFDYAFAKAYTLTFNASKNYRIPTFNDAYWSGPGAVGNPDLKPETSIQAEIGLKRTRKNLTLGLRGFYINTDDLIQWQPNLSGIWSPINIADSEHYGIEGALDYTAIMGSHKVTTTAQYAYTQAEDVARGKQLIYVPAHKAILGIAHNYGRLSSYVQTTFVDRVFTTTDNTAQVDGYAIAHIGTSYDILHKQGTKLQVMARVNNLFNTNYQTVAFRPNPGRNFLLQTTITF